MRTWLLPEHIEDVLPGEARAIEALRRTILDLFESHGYQLVAPPLLEYLESLLSGTGRDLDLATFKLVDRLSGRLMGVRADHTPQVARIDAHLLNRQGVARLCYCGSVLHTVPSGMTKMREPIQIGAELYGHAGIEADLEVLRLMIAALKRANVGDLHVDLGHPNIYRALTEGLKLEPEVSEALFHAVQQKDAPAAVEIAGKGTEAGEALAALTTLNGGVDVIARARKALPKSPTVQAALDVLEKLAGKIGGPGVQVSVDLAELGGFNYESGLAFAAFAKGSPDAIARGGRYDEVGATFGRARPATGFTMDLRQLAALVAAVEKLRADGEIVIVDLPGHEDARVEIQYDRTLVKKDGQWRVT